MLKSVAVASVVESVVVGKGLYMYEDEKHRYCGKLRFVKNNYANDALKIKPQHHHETVESLLVTRVYDKNGTAKHLEAKNDSFLFLFFEN